MQFTHALFDMDGTLVDSMGYWDETCGALLKELGVYSEELFDILKPMTVPQTADYLKAAFGIERSVWEMRDQMCRIMKPHYENDVQPKADVVAFLEALKQKGVHMCVASSTANDLVDLCLRRHGLTQYFDFLISAEDVGIGKDHPDIYYEAARRLHAEPGSIMVFEDAMKAGVTAKSAGFLVSAIYDETSKEEWDAFRAQTDHAFRSWKEAFQNLL